MKSLETLENRWGVVGILFVVPAAASSTVDLERLLVDTAEGLRTSPRLLAPVVTWLSEYSDLIAKHRLRACARYLSPFGSATLGLVLESAIHHGGSQELQLAAAACNPLQPPRALFDADTSNPVFSRLARQTASRESAHWGVWCPAVELKHEVIRPRTWLFQQHPELKQRAVRRGDLRSSILETLRHDTPTGSVVSEAELARRTTATRAAVRKALHSLVQEGEVAVTPGGGTREKRIALAA